MTHVAIMGFHNFKNEKQIYLRDNDYLNFLVHRDKTVFDIRSMDIGAKNSIILFHTHFVFEKSLIVFEIPHTTVILKTLVSRSSLGFHSHAVLKGYFVELCSRETLF